MVGGDGGNANVIHKEADYDMEARRRNF